MKYIGKTILKLPVGFNTAKGQIVIHGMSSLLFSGSKWHGLGVISLGIKKGTFFIFKLRTSVP